MSDSNGKTSVDTKQIRPAMIADRPTLRYYSTSLSHIFSGLATESCQSALVCPPEVEDNTVVSPSVEIIRYPLFKNAAFYFQNRKALLEELTRFKPTILHCLTGKKARLTAYLAKALNVPYVITYNSSVTARRPVSAKHCAAMIASSSLIAEQLKHSHKRLAACVEHINIGAFVEDTCACFSDMSSVPSMVVAQRLDNAIEFEPLLNAVRHLAIDGYEFMLAIIGRGPAERAIHKLIKSLGISQSVIVVPRINPLQSVFAGADIFIQPHISTEFNPYLLDAMSVGMAIASCRGGVENLLVEDETSAFFEPYDELSIYSSLQGLLDKRENARRIAMGGQSYLRKHHSVTNMVSSLLETYRKAEMWNTL